MSGSVGVLRFPGTNCDRDIMQAVVAAGGKPEYVWYQDRFDYNQYDAFIIPGGFSYGDYLRSGALAAQAPAMNDLKDAADAGKPVMGICNGFQILCEAGLLPGALMRNENMRFIDKWVELEMKNPHDYFGGNRIAVDEQVRFPIAHADGRYFVNETTLSELRDQGQIWLEYCDNPNGSVANIAGVKNRAGNVCGMMPHPERAMFDWMGGGEGMMIFL